MLNTRCNFSSYSSRSCPEGISFIARSRSEGVARACAMKRDALTDMAVKRGVRWSRRICTDLLSRAYPRSDERPERVEDPTALHAARVCM